MYSARMASPSPRDLMLFYKLEMDFYMRLVHHLNQDKDKVKWVMALWLWFESIGHHDFIRRVSSCRPHVILGFIKEADACVDHLIWNVLRSVDGVAETGGNSGEDAKELPLTSSLMSEEINMRFFDIHHDKALKETRYYFDTVCKVIFDDALMEVAALPRGQPSHVTNNRVKLSSALRLYDSGEGSSSRNIPLFDAGVIFPIAYQASPPPPPPPPSPRYTLNPMAVPWSPSSTSQISMDQRSMFITFSRGHPIARGDIEDFFNMQYGKCIDVVMIEKTAQGVPPMYGRLVFTNPAVIPVILKGKRTAKFMIKGRHLWARMYVAKNNACTNM